MKSATAEVTTAANSFAQGEFTVTITPIRGSNYNKLAYVDTSGKTAYYVGSGTTNLIENVAIPDGQVAEDTGTVSVQITYAGSLAGNDTAILAAWNALGKTKIDITLSANNNGKLAATTGHAYSGAATLALSNLSLGEVAFSSGSYTINPIASYLYAVAGQASIETGSTVTISCSAASLVA